MLPRPSTDAHGHRADRKSTRLNSSHVKISYAVFCLKKKKKKNLITKFIKKKKNIYILREHFISVRVEFFDFVITYYMTNLIVFSLSYFFFFFNDTATTEIYTLSLHDALPISTNRWTEPGPWGPSRSSV